MDAKIQEILNNIKNVLLITCVDKKSVKLTASSPFYKVYCVYTSDLKHDLIIKDGYNIRIRSIKTLLESYPKNLEDWENMAHIIYCADNNFFIDYKELLKSTLQSAIILARKAPVFYYDPSRERFRIILKQFLETGEINCNLSLEQLKQSTVAIEKLAYFNNFKDNIKVLLLFKNKIYKLLLEYGGNGMYTLEDSQALKDLLEIDKGNSPAHRSLAELEAMKVIGYMHQFFSEDELKFKKAYETFNLNEYCELSTMKNIISLSLKFWNPEAEQYFTEIMAATIPSLLFRKATYDLCLDYIIQSGFLKKYKKEADIIVNDEAFNMKVEEGEYSGWAFFN